MHVYLFIKPLNTSAYELDTFKFWTDNSAIMHADSWITRCDQYFIIAARNELKKDNSISEKLKDKPLTMHY
jgi:hypothetical protein